MEVFTPNTGQTANLLTGEERAELRGKDNYLQLPNGKMAGSISTGGGGSSGGGSGKKTAKKLDKSAESDIIKTEEQKRLQEMIDNGEVSLKINPNIQNRHYQGTSEYKTYLADGVEKSYFTVPMSDLQQFLNKKAATGSVRIDRDGKPNEVFDFGKNIAYDTKMKRKTSFVKVHYSKSKTHLSPYTPRPKANNRKGG